MKFSILLSLTKEQGIQIGLFGFNINTHTASILDGGNQPFSLTNLDQVANSVVAIISKPEQTANQFLYVDSFTVTQNQILAALEKATGKKWDVTASTTHAAIKHGRELLAKGDHAGAISLLQVNFVGAGYGSDYSRDAELVIEMLGLPKQSLEESVTKLVEGKSS